MTNAGDSFCNSYIYHLVGLHISDIGKVISSLLQSLSSLLLLSQCPLTAAMHFTTLEYIFANVSYGFLTVNSNTANFDKKKFFLRHPVVVEVTMNMAK